MMIPASVVFFEICGLIAVCSGKMREERAGPS